MPDAILPLKRYFDFFGRSRRREFWRWVLLYVVVSILLLALDLMTGLGGSIDSQATPDSSSYQLNGGLLSSLWFFGTLVPNFMVTARRLHDSGRTSWWICLPAIPFLVLKLLPPLLFVDSIDASTEEGVLKIAMYFSAFALLNLLADVIFFVFLCIDGTVGTNRYGPNPKDQERIVIVAGDGTQTI